jgi:PRTase ComF-like
MFENKEIVRSLHQLTDYPPDLSHPIYREYPFFKLGVKNGVEYFSERLTPIVEEIMAANPDYSSWVLTSPPSHRIPTAANLLCHDIFERMKNKKDTWYNLSLVKLYNFREEGNIDENARDFSNFSSYSSYSWEERLVIIRKNKFIINEENFRDCGIVFINDINVTGSSQEYISQVFAKVYPYKINWLYIIDCDKTTGRKDPQLEYEINNANINTLDDFAAILDRDDIRHTAKCISKLFSCSIAELAQLPGMLNRSHASRLWNSIQQEDLYQGDIFKEKMELIRRIC